MFKEKDKNIHATDILNSGKYTTKWKTENSNS